MRQETESGNALRARLQQQLGFIYRDIALPQDTTSLAAELVSLMRLGDLEQSPQKHRNLWDQSDIILITYADSILRDGEKPLKTLQHFLQQQVDGMVSGVHILPFYPFSSDDGFSVIDYSSVNEALGSWEDVRLIAADYRLMADLVINHCSSRSRWFANFLKGVNPGRDYFFTVAENTDTSAVTRPRTNPLLRQVETTQGTRHVWCTFSHDQVDLDFRNPEVLKQFVSIIRLYLDQGVRIFRLDAVAFLWKIPGTNCINLEETHEVVRLLRTLIEHAEPDAVVITETNIPNSENLAYFGNANEAHCVYNFSLPPLLLNTLVTGDCSYLKQWMMSMPPARNGTAYFNFIASHDGIGLRPAEGLLSPEEIDRLVQTMQSFGGSVSWRTLENGDSKPYEINISLFDALQGTVAGSDNRGVERFLCAHAIMLGLEGIPGVYIHSLLGTRNDYRRMKGTGHNRAINRHQWQYQQLTAELQQEDSTHYQVFNRLRALLTIRRRQAAFHPNATQFTLHLGAALFGFWRQSMDRRQSIFCISNISPESQALPLADINLIDSENWSDLISGQQYQARDQLLALAPYQTLWISNHRD